MKKEIIEYLGFDDEEKSKVGRPKLADKKTKKKSLIFASLSFLFVTLLFIFGYGTLFGFRNLNLKGTITKKENKEFVLIDEIKPLVKDVTLKEGTARKIYLTVLPATASNKLISYFSSDVNVAMVDDAGKVTGISEGNATITAKTNDGTNLSTDFNIKVIKNADGKCEFTTLSKTSDGVYYVVDCNNAKIKEIQYKVKDGYYESLLTKKMTDEVKFSDKQLKEDISFKVVYYPNNSKVTKYHIKTIKGKKTTTSKKINGICTLDLNNVKSNSAKYNISCENASVSKIAYKIGNGSYIGIDASSLADTIIFEESDVTRVIYFNVEYIVDGSSKSTSITKSSIIEKKDK